MKRQTDKDGHKINRIRLDGLESTDEKRIGTRLQEIARNATTGGLYTRIGEVYGFPIYVISEPALKDGISTIQNRFVVEGHYKYNYNNGQLAMADTKAAARNFLNALERIPQIVEQYKAKNEALEKDLPILQEVAGKTWKKEDELKQLKSELAALDRKIQLEFVHPHSKVVGLTNSLLIQSIEQTNSPPLDKIQGDCVHNHIINVRPEMPPQGGVKGVKF